MTSVQTAAIAEHNPTPPVVPIVCPLCHTVESTMTDESLHAGDSWRCAACGQVWSARRLEAVAAYARYVAAH